MLYYTYRKSLSGFFKLSNKKPYLFLALLMPNRKWNGKVPISKFCLTEIIKCDVVSLWPSVQIPPLSLACLPPHLLLPFDDPLALKCACGMSKNGAPQSVSLNYRLCFPDILVSVTTLQNSVTLPSLTCIRVATLSDGVTASANGR